MFKGFDTKSALIGAVALVIVFKLVAPRVPFVANIKAKLV